MSRHGAWARAVVDGLRAGGIEAFVVCPGSRSAPLAIAAWPYLPDADRAAIVDERSAGFYALGLSLSGRPAAVITTSGSAVANLLPAAVEAHQADVPLALVTADRPPAMRGTGANQTIAQPGLFGGYVRHCEDLPLPATDPAPARRAAHHLAARATRGAPPGPVHLNVPFEKPLEPDAADLEGPRPGGADAVPAADPGDAVRSSRDGEDMLDSWLRARGPRGVVVVGPHRDRGLAAPLFALARRLQVPVIADGLAQVRWADPGDAVLVGGHEAFLADPQARAALRPDWILQMGGLPVSRHLAVWVRQHADVPRARIDATGRGWDGMGTPCALVPGDPRRILEALAAPGALRGAARAPGQSAAPDASWPRLWQAVEDATQAAGGPGPCTEAAVAGLLADLPHRLFVGNSLPVRDLDRMARPRHRPWEVLGNRGASGIDGLIATTAGIGGIGLIGDMAFRHDVGSLPLLRRRGARLVVVDNGGGRIFDRLPVRDAPLPAGAYDALFLARAEEDLAAMARAAGLDAAACDLAGLQAAVAPWAADEARRPDVVVVRTDGEAGHQERQAHLDAVAAAVRPLLP